VFTHRMMKSLLYSLLQAYEFERRSCHLVWVEEYVNSARCCGRLHAKVNGSIRVFNHSNNIPGDLIMGVSFLCFFGRIRNLIFER